MTPETNALVGQGLFVVVVAGTSIINHFKGRRRDRTQATSLKEQFAEQRQYMDARFNELESGVAEVRSFCVGPDGENGFRADIKEVKARVIGLEDRERDRLHGPYDRRQ